MTEFITTPKQKPTRNWKNGWKFSAWGTAMRERKWSDGWKSSHKVPGEHPIANNYKSAATKAKLGFSDVLKNFKKKKTDEV